MSTDSVSIILKLMVILALKFPSKMITQFPSYLIDYLV